ncbi:hypothetical protein SGRIM128S_09664 [Streptomyces griseomycini]
MGIIAFVALNRPPKARNTVISGIGAVILADAVRPVRLTAPRTDHRPGFLPGGEPELSAGMTRTTPQPY